MSIRNKKILLTGVTGFLGSCLLNRLIAMNCDVVILLRPTSNKKRIDHLLKHCAVEVIGKESFDAILQRHEIDTIVHLAASYGRKGETLNELIEANLLFPLQLLKAAVSCGVTQFINTGTSLSPLVNEYALSKHQFAQWLNFYQRKIGVCHLNLEYFYGPGDDSWKFISMLFEKFIKNEPAIEFTSGEQKRDFIYIDDVLSAFITVLNGSVHNNIQFTVGSGAKISIKELAILCKEISGNQSTQLLFGALPDRGNETLISETSSSDIQSLGWSPKVDLNTGLKYTYEAMKKTSLQTIHPF
jgi:nucleoside-diphosphate-sugar epimerase